MAASSPRAAAAASPAAGPQLVESSNSMHCGSGVRITSSGDHPICVGNIINRDKEKAGPPPPHDDHYFPTVSNYALCLTH